MGKEVIIFIDMLAPKNKLQADAIHMQQMNIVFFVTTMQPINFLAKPDAQYLLLRTFFKRLRQVFIYLRRNKKNIHHIEVYPGGRFSFVLVILAKLFAIKCICVERGDLLYYNKKGYNRLTRFSMWYCYKFSDMVWYKEPYMKDKLKNIGVRKLFFLHNAIDTHVDSDISNYTERDIDFLWLNRIIPERKAEWFVEILQTPAFKNTNNHLAGIIKNSSYKKEQGYLLNQKFINLTVSDYVSTPEQYYKRAKYFVLPADVVFANNALLEAMFYGVVPLVSNQMGAELIIEHNKNGFIFNHTKEDFEAAMHKSLKVTADGYDKYSMAAKNKITEDFSENFFYLRLSKLYNSL